MRRAALRINSGKILLNFGVQESLLAFLYPFFTGQGRAFDKTAKKSDLNSSFVPVYRIFQEIVYTMLEVVVLYKIV